MAMVECPCIQCGEFRDYVQCERCRYYGHETDDFGADPDGDVCDLCYEDLNTKTGETKT